MADITQRRRMLLLLLLLHRRRKKRQLVKRSKWVREIFELRAMFGEYHALIREMRVVDHTSFYRYFHMTPDRFDDLLGQLEYTAPH